MKRILKTNIKEILYFIGYFLMGLAAVVIGNSYLFGSRRFQLCEVVQYVAAAMFLISFCIDRYKIKNFVAVILLGVATLLVATVMHNIAFALFGLSVVTSVHINVRRIVKNSVINNIIFLTIVIVPALFVVFQTLQEKFKPVVFKESADPMIIEEMNKIALLKQQKESSKTE